MIRWPASEGSARGISETRCRILVDTWLAVGYNNPISIIGGFSHDLAVYA